MNAATSSGRPPRVAFVGNCQAQSMESLCGHLGVKVEVVTLPPVFDVPAFNTDAVWDKLTGCDFVFNQRVAPDYPCEFARPSFLQSHFGSRAVSWPNIYFDGYFPGIEYVYSYSGKIVGPLSDYHFRFVRAAWARGTPVDELERDFSHGELAASFAAGAEASLHQLRLRESGLTVRMSDAVCARWRYHKTMHTMNHPDNDLLAILLRRLLRHAGVGVHWSPVQLRTYPYPLSEISVPPFPSLAQRHGLGFAVEATVGGRRMAWEGRQWRMQPGAASYSWRSLFEAFYRLYDSESEGSAETATLLRTLF